MENILLDKKKRNVKIVGKLFRYHCIISKAEMIIIILQILD